MSNRGVIILKNIPHGFYEKQMYGYFSQFGTISRIRLLRSRKTTKSKGIAFIEFLHEDVAKIAAQTMNNYLMFERILKCHLMPQDRLPPRLFRGWKKKPRSSVLRHKSKVISSTRKNWDRLRQKKLTEIKQREAKLRSMGIDFSCLIRESAEIPKGNINGSKKSSSPSQFGDEPRMSFSRMSHILLSLPKFAILSSLRPELLED